jgi:hypothetical protein
MIATRLSSVWQVAGVAAAALCCYLVSQSVAAERAGLIKVDREIARTQDDIARLNTELGARGRMEQLEAWNTQVLELKAPRPAQYVSGSTQLVSLYARNGRPALQLDPSIVAQQGATTRVSYQPAPAAAPVPAPEVARADPGRAPEPVEVETPSQPLLRTATFVRPKPQRLAPEASPISHVAYRPVLSAASALSPVSTSSSASAESSRPASASRPTRASGSVLASLLPADIADIAAAERGKGRRAKADR